MESPEIHLGLLQRSISYLPGPLFALVIAISSVVFLLYFQAFGTDIPHISGIPEAPGAVPFYGHLKVLAQDHPTRFQRWGNENNWPILQARMGNRRVVVLNTFEAADEWIVKNAFATVDRPLFYTFHKIVSSTQGMTIGTSPWDESCKRRRTAVGIYMTRPAIQRNAPVLDEETFALAHDMYKASKRGTVEIDPAIFFKREALNLSLALCYGTRIDSIDSPLLREILSVVQNVSTFRSTNNNPQDYVPLLRFLPGKRSQVASECRNRRDIWLNQLLDTVRAAIEKGTEQTCLSEGLLRDSGNSKLSEDEIKSINVSLVSGGFETVSSTGVSGIAVLSTKEGQILQEKAYDELLSVYASSEEAWERCVLEEKSPYTVALVREMLRYYAPLQLLPPRKTIKEFQWRGLTIPKGLSVLMNAQAINHGKHLHQIIRYVTQLLMVFQQTRHSMDLMQNASGPNDGCASTHPRRLTTIPMGQGLVFALQLPSPTACYMPPSYG